MSKVYRTKPVHYTRLDSTAPNRLCASAPKSRWDGFPPAAASQGCNSHRPAHNPYRFLSFFLLASSWFVSPLLFFNLLPKRTVLFCYFYMHRRLADPEFLRRLPYCRIMVYDVIGNGNCPFFDIFLHEAASENVFYIILIVRRNYAWLNSALLYAWNQYDTVLKKSFVSIFFLSPPHVSISASQIHMPPLNDPFYQCRACRWCRPVSYTHLTLPTNSRV